MTEAGTRIGKSGDQFKITKRSGSHTLIPSRQVGLEPALGFYHQPRTQAPPLALDLMEIFRVPLVDMPMMASVNRGQWQVEDDFTVKGEQVWLSDAGRRRLIGLYERRKEESWKHPERSIRLPING